MERKYVKKFLAVLLVVAMMSSYLGFFGNVSEAATLSSWWTHNRRYLSGFSYRIEGRIQNKSLFYDIGQDYENLHCIRCGASQAGQYDAIDLYDFYESKAENSRYQAIYNDLFVKDTNDPDRYFKHVLWAIQNFYWYSHNDTPEVVSAKLNEFKDFVVATKLPYGMEETVTNTYVDPAWEKGKQGPTTTKNEQLIRVLQNEMLLKWVKQTTNYSADLSDISYNGNRDQEAINFAQKVEEKFGTLENSDNVSIKEIIEKSRALKNDEAKVTITANTSTMTNENLTGDFSVNNKYKAKITNMEVWVKGESDTAPVEKSNYTIKGEGGTTDINKADLLESLTNSAYNSDVKFKIYIPDLAPGSNEIEVKLNVDYGDSLEVTLLVPKGFTPNAYSGQKGDQYLLNINKEHKTDTVSTSTETNAIEEFDLALTKQVTNVYTDEEKDGLSYTRLMVVDTTQLQRGKNNAVYNMTKKPVSVTPGAIVEYKITVYNEGKINGFAKEITDYLPEGLELITDTADEYGNQNINEYKWVVDNSNNRIIKTTYLQDEEIHCFNGTKLESKSVLLYCRVKDNVKDGDILDNVAEISEYGYYLNGTFVDASNKNVDRDSEQDSIENDSNLTNVGDIIENIATRVNGQIINTRQDDKNNVSFQDDDDIERLKVSNEVRCMDLALRKWISNVDGVDYDRAPEQLNIFNGKEEEDYGNALTLNQMAVSQGTLEYAHPKDAVSLNPGSIVTYTIGVFNEGMLAGYAEEITDYLPEGLEFIEDGEEGARNRDNGWSVSEDGKVVTTNIFSHTNETASNPTILSILMDRYTSHRAENGDLDSARTVEIICRVKDDVVDGKYLTNRAEITKYGYYDKQNNVVIVSKQNVSDGIDRDSQPNTIEEDLGLEEWYDDQFKDVDPQTPPNNFPGEQDDDDFETVVVKKIPESPEYNLIIEKTDSVTNQPITDGQTTFDVKVYSNITEDETTKEVSFNSADLSELKNKDNETITTINKSVNEAGKIEITGIDVAASQAQPGTYYWVIEETKTSEGYNGINYRVVIPLTLEDNDGTYRVTYNTANIFALEKGEDGKEYRKTLNEVAQNNNSKEVVVNVDEANLTMTVVIPNAPDTPDIQKGVKTVENQNSGYYDKGINGVTINKDEDSAEYYYKDIDGNKYTAEELEDVVHKWVVETTIEKGIENYNKYIVTDKIETGKLDFLGVDSVVVNLIDTNNNVVKTLVKDEDYKVSYDSTMSTLSVKYISKGMVDFTGKFIQDAEVGSLTGYKLRIEYNTTFKVVDGKLVVLTDTVQNAENQATLIYNNGIGQDVEKPSETPEVHTGAVSVFKYEDTNHNGEWDAGEPSIEGAKFKIALNKENAEKGIYIKDANGEDWVETSNEKGIATFIGLQFGGDANSEESNKQEDGTYKYDWTTVSTDYYIEEVEAPENYLLLDEGIVVTVSKNSTECINLTDKITGVANIAKDGNYNFTVTKKDAETDKVIEDETTTFDITVYSKLTETKEENGTKVTFDAKDVVELKTANGVTINTKGIKTKTNGKAIIGQIAVSVAEIEKGTYYFVVDEVSAPDKYTEIGYKVVVPITFELVDGKYVVTHKTAEAFALVKDSKGNEYKKTLKEVSTKENECSSTEQTDVTINVNVPNKQKVFDLSLRKFITKVNDKELTGEDSREPKVDVTTLKNGDPKKNGEKTATYTHDKTPVEVNPQDIVEYTLRVYNEGELDGYASQIIDDIPEGVEMVAPKYDENGKALNQNAEYKWVMYKEMEDVNTNSKDTANKLVLRYDNKYYIETDKPEEAVIISTDYLSMANGEIVKAAENKEENPNLLKAYNGGESLDSRDVKVQFKVKASNKENKVITNYAQISENEYKDGTPIPDRDSIPNVWNEGEDDQDVEHIKVNWFDLALYKWVSSVIVTEDGKTSEFATEHTEEYKDKIVNVTVAKEKLDKTVVKFKYQIKVDNQGTLAGYAKEVKDHIPAGLKFVEEDNKEFGWKLAEDGKITTDYLKDTLLQPKQTAEVTVVLTWINGETNLGTKINYAEISEDYNDYGAKDVDSVPDNFNKKPVEDDEDGDEVRLNIKTGNGINYTYVFVGIVILAIVAAGAYGVKKVVLVKE